VDLDAGFNFGSGSNWLRPGPPSKIPEISEILGLEN